MAHLTLPTPGLEFTVLAPRVRHYPLTCPLPSLRDPTFEPTPALDGRGRPLSFSKGMKVEAVDRSFKDIITVATIKDIDNDKVMAPPALPRPWARILHPASRRPAALHWNIPALNPWTRPRSSLGLTAGLIPTTTGVPPTAATSSPQAHASVPTHVCRRPTATSGTSTGGAIWRRSGR